MNLPPGVSSHTAQTRRLRMHYIESGPADGVPVVLIHGNLATGRFFEHLLFKFLASVEVPAAV
jgi:pimeloyl-ACP methyl ester carboxylesterase